MAEGVDTKNAQHPPRLPAELGRRVFISYASHDASAAQDLCSALESAGFPCWMAPRDVKAGALYADAIVRAISNARAFVLVLSESSINSSHVGKEIERASSKKCPVIALRIDAAPLTPALEYFLSESQWVEAQAGNNKAAYARLIDAIRETGQPAPGIAPGVPSGTLTVKGRAVRPTARRNWIPLAAGIAVVAVALTALLVNKFWLEKHVAAGQPMTTATNVVGDKSIAVLPFVDMSEKHDQEYFADGMAEEVTDLLAKLPGIRVIGRTSSFQFRGKSLDLRTIGTTLNVTYVLEGSVRRSADQVRVTAQLISTLDGAHRWSNTYDAKFDDVLKVQDAIASNLARALEVAVGTMATSDRRTGPPEAYDLFMQGRQALDTNSKESCERAIGLFNQVLQLDPTSTRALVSLAQTYNVLGDEGWMPPKDAFGEARHFALRALQIDSNIAGAHVVLAYVHMLYDWDWAAAQKELDLAFGLGRRDAWALRIAAELASTRAEWARAEQLVREALAQDPLDATAQVVLGYWIYARQDRYVEAEAPLRHALQISPNFGTGRYFLSISLLMQGRLQEALDEAQSELPQDGKYQVSSEVLYAMHRKLESDDALKKAIKQSEGDWPVSIAKVYAFRGERDLAITWLERAYQFHDEDLYFIKGDPQLRSLEADSRYKAFLRKMNLPE